MPDCNDFASLIPETPKLQRLVASEAMAQPAHREGIRHYGVLLRDIALGAYEQWTIIDADAVRIVSPVSVNVEVEGVGTIQEEAFFFPYNAPPAPQGCFPPLLQGGVGGMQVNTGDPALFMPAGDWLIDRPIRAIRFPQTRDPVDLDWLNQRFPNAVVHLFVMRGNVRNLGFGRPIPHSIVLQAEENGTAIMRWTPVRPTIYGDNATSGECGMIPLLTEITGFSWNFSSGTAPFGVQEVYIAHRTLGGFLHPIGLFFPPQLAVGDHELGIPIEFSPLQCRQNEAIDAARGSLDITIICNGIFDGGIFNLRMRSYM